MKKRILAIVLATTALVNLAPATATAKTAHTYKARGTVRNFTYSMQYEDGEKLTGRGFDIYTTDGNTWEMSGKMCGYSKFEGVEWVESAKTKITVQRGGDWLQITQKPERITQTYSRYDGKNYLDKW